MSRRHTCESTARPIDRRHASARLLAAVALASILAGCPNARDEQVRACGDYARRACPAGCGSTADCTALWLEAAELDPGDTLESCIATCPRTTCAEDVFFDCTCYGNCLGQASGPLQEAVLAATRCDLGGVPATCP